MRNLAIGQSVDKLSADIATMSCDLSQRFAARIAERQWWDKRDGSSQEALCKIHRNPWCKAMAMGIVIAQQRWKSLAHTPDT